MSRLDQVPYLGITPADMSYPETFELLTRYPELLGLHSGIKSTDLSRTDKLTVSEFSYTITDAGLKSIGDNFTSTEFTEFTEH